MTPDYPHKIFGDKRTSYNLLVQVLAIDSLPKSLPRNKSGQAEGLEMQSLPKSLQRRDLKCK
jgi:hypothetical protein